MVKKRVLGRHHHKYDALHWKNLPPGIKVLISYVGAITLIYLLYFISGITKPVSVIFGKLISGPLAYVLEIGSLIVLIVILYGLIKREFWVFYVSLAWFTFGLLNAVVSLLSFKSEFDVLRTVLVASSFVVIVLNGIIVWYVYSEKYYFKVKHLNKETKAKDKFFVYLISTFLVVSLLILLTFGVNFYNTTIKTTNKVIAELNNAPDPEIVCAQKTGNEKDICYLVLSIKEDGRNRSLCDSIVSDFYKITCYRALQ